MFTDELYSFTKKFTPIGISKLSTINAAGRIEIPYLVDPIVRVNIVNLILDTQVSASIYDMPVEILTIFWNRELYLWECT